MTDQAQIITLIGRIASVFYMTTVVYILLNCDEIFRKLDIKNIPKGIRLLIFVIVIIVSYSINTIIFSSVFAVIYLIMNATVIYAIMNTSF